MLANGGKRLPIGFSRFLVFRFSGFRLLTLDQPKKVRRTHHRFLGKLTQLFRAGDGNELVAN